MKNFVMDGALVAKRVDFLKTIKHMHPPLNVRILTDRWQTFACTFYCPVDSNLLTTMGWGRDMWGYSGVRKVLSYKVGINLGWTDGQDVARLLRKVLSAHYK